MGKLLGLLVSVSQNTAAAALLTGETSFMVVKAHFPAFTNFHGFALAYYFSALAAAVTGTLSFPAADCPVSLEHGGRPLAVLGNVDSRRVESTLPENTRIRNLSSGSCTTGCDDVFSIVTFSLHLLQPVLQVSTCGTSRKAHSPSRESCKSNSNQGIPVDTQPGRIDLSDGLHRSVTLGRKGFANGPRFSSFKL